MSEEALEELDVKAILVKQTHELMEIRQQLQLLNMGVGETPTESGESQVVCKECQIAIPESEKEAHAEQEHNWATSMGTDVLSRFYATDD